tara:strand:+ start:1141 stop:1668 length:528 start_codon:yes stop_codon:yes gene_type:complete
MQGVGDFYGGILHPLVVPAHVLALVMLGLLAGQRGMAAVRRTYLGFLPALVAGLALSGTGFVDDPEPLLLLASAVMGLLVVLQWRVLPAGLFPAVGATVALLLGLDSAPEGPGLAPGPYVATLAGTALGAFACLLLVADLSERASAGWQRIGLRVLGSWGAASATLVYAMRWLVP